MNKTGGPTAKKYCRSVDIMADAAYGILIKSPQSFTGNLVYDEDFLMNEGVTDFDQYRAEPGWDRIFPLHIVHMWHVVKFHFFAGSSEKLFPDLFTDEVPDFSILEKFKKTD